MRQAHGYDGPFFLGGCGKGFTGDQSAFRLPGGKQAKRADTGFKNLADLMNQLQPPAAKEILETIESTEPELAISIRDLMFTFENFLDVPEPDMRELITLMDKKTLAIALKSASEELRTHIYQTMSSRAVEMMKEDSEMMGPVRSKDVVKAQSEMVDRTKARSRRQDDAAQPGRR